MHKQPEKQKKRKMVQELKEQKSSAIKSSLKVIKQNIVSNIVASELFEGPSSIERRKGATKAQS